MWPFKHPAEGEFLRIGIHAIERWKAVDQSLVLQAEHAFPPDITPKPKDLLTAIRALYSSSPQAPITVLLESAWLPVVLLDVGRTLLRPPQLEALARHHFALNHSDSAQPVAIWELRIEYRPGSGHALAYGLPPDLKKTLVDAARASSIEWKALTPALSWGLERIRAFKLRVKMTGWCIWPEQDRLLVVHTAGSALNGLNPGVALPTDETALLRCIEAEGVRLGMVSDTDAIIAVTWTDAPKTILAERRLTWISLQNPHDFHVTTLRPTITRAAA